ncbi:MAG: type II toxin-antitoxin system HigB family toxin [Planctomycetia bacterium]|nr:type II toxin-antitoxin system HigB family toxin [Planctomycetia bacterium]
MRIITGKTIRNYQDKYPLAAQQLEAWYYEAKNANWQNPNEIKEKYGSASILQKNRVVFNICGNKFRLIVQIAYRIGTVYIRFLGTHKEYDEVNAEEI